MQYNKSNIATPLVGFGWVAWAGKECRGEGAVVWTISVAFDWAGAIIIKQLACGWAGAVRSHSL